MVCWSGLMSQPKTCCQVQAQAVLLLSADVLNVLMLVVEVLIADVLAVRMLVKETLKVLVVVVLADVLEASKC